jgi:hypothetical protein
LQFHAKKDVEAYEYLHKLFYLKAKQQWQTHSYQEETSQDIERLVGR